MARLFALIVAVVFASAFSQNLVLEGSKAYIQGKKAKAAKYFSKACRQNNMAGCYNLGLLFHKGEGVPKNPAKAAHLYSKACHNGLMVACNNLATLYYNGTGVRKNRQKAATLYQNRAEVNFPKLAKTWLFSI